MIEPVSHEQIVNDLIHDAKTKIGTNHFKGKIIKWGWKNSNELLKDGCRARERYRRYRGRNYYYIEFPYGLLLPDLTIRDEGGNPVDEIAYDDEGNPETGYEEAFDKLSVMNARHSMEIVVHELLHIGYNWDNSKEEEINSMSASLVSKWIEGNGNH